MSNPTHTLEVSLGNLLADAMALGVDETEAMEARAQLAKYLASLDEKVAGLTRRLNQLEEGAA